MDWSGSGSAAGAHFNFRHGFHLPHSFPRRTTLQSHRFQRAACPRENRRHSEVRVSHRRWHVYHSGRCTCQSCTCRCSTMGCRFANIAALAVFVIFVSVFFPLYYRYGMEPIRIAMAVYLLALLLALPLLDELAKKHAFWGSLTSFNPFRHSLCVWCWRAAPSLACSCRGACRFVGTPGRNKHEQADEQPVGMVDDAAAARRHRRARQQRGRVRGAPDRRGRPTRSGRTPGGARST